MMSWIIRNLGKVMIHLDVCLEVTTVNLNFVDKLLVKIREKLQSAKFNSLQTFLAIW